MIHLCHAHGCLEECAPKHFCCPPHWYTLRAEMRKAIWKEYKVGQEIRKDPTFRYLAVQQRAVAEIAMYKPKSAKRLAAWDEAMARVVAAPYFQASEHYRRCAIERGEGDPLAGLV